MGKKGDDNNNIKDDNNDDNKRIVAITIPDGYYPGHCLLIQLPESTKTKTTTMPPSSLFKTPPATIPNRIHFNTEEVKDNNTSSSKREEEIVVQGYDVVLSNYYPQGTEDLLLVESNRADNCFIVSSPSSDGKDKEYEIC